MTKNQNNENKIGTIPLKFALTLSEQVNYAWKSGELIKQVTPTTADLLHYWFDDTFCQNRILNFHVGQKQAILNAIYVHEVLKSKSVFDMYVSVAQDTTFEPSSEFLTNLQKENFNYPKYCIKMATGTGKTWIINALLIWQYLNAKANETTEQNYTKNFLIVAPGLIVYERLLDAFKGKIQLDGSRDFYTADMVKNADLFLPESYREQMYAFLQNSVCAKKEIGKITGDGLIAITNWHLLSGDEDEKVSFETSKTSLNDSKNIVDDLLPITPGINAGHDLNIIDNTYLNGGALDYLSNLPSICVFNDEAHHIHEGKEDVKWQEALTTISKTKGEKYTQIDFSATPFESCGAGENRSRKYFSHIITDFDLKTAVMNGLVKAISIDKRKEFASVENEELDFKAVRDDKKKVIDLSSGQKMMLRAGLSKLNLLEEQFVALTKDKNGMSNKYPKMLVICEDTNVTPLVEKFFKREGLQKDEILSIDSNKKGSIPPEQWEVKEKLFNLDNHEKPKVVISVLMLREGFDVSNVCVIVPLRSSQAPILLEQVLGRGLRLMWREEEYQDIKRENLDNLYKKKIAPTNYLDILSIIEHPAFERFYEDLDKDMFIDEDSETKPLPPAVGDLINVGLKENYKDYDMYIPFIIHDKEEVLNSDEIDISKLKPLQLNWNFDQLKKMIENKIGETFYSKDIMVKTNWGEYKVTGDLFNSNSYNEFLSKILKVITENISRFNYDGRKRELPVLEFNLAKLMKVIDQYIRTTLFNQEFNPLEGNNWRILMLTKSGIVEHIMKEISKVIYQIQNHIDVKEAEVRKNYFSQVDNLKIREMFALDLQKTIYEKVGYPSNRGGLEKEFMQACDNDTDVSKFIKVNEYKHLFARLKYLRTDGMLASYSPDFMVCCKDKVFVVETKSDKDAINDANVLQKQKGALDWIAKINELSPENRMNAEWVYVLLDETSFYSWKNNGASMYEILSFASLKQTNVTGLLF